MDTAFTSSLVIQFVQQEAIRKEGKTEQQDEQLVLQRNINSY